MHQSLDGDTGALWSPWGRAEAQRRFRALFEALPVPTYAWRRNDDLVLVAYNRAAAVSSGGRAAGYLGVRAADVYAGEPDILADLRRAAAESDPLDREMTYTIPGTAESYRLHVTYVPVPPDLVMVHLEDVTEQRALEDELRTTVESLRLLDRDRRRLTAELVNAQEDERRRIAQDVHDDVIQTMTALGLRLEVVDRSPDADPEALSQLAADVRGAIERLRHLTFDLHPDSLDRDGLAAAIVHLGSQAPAGAARLEVRSRLAHEPPRDLRVQAYRIIREAVMNAWKHTNASRIVVELDREGAVLALAIRDEGAGFDPAASVDLPGHLGLASMRRRAELLGGTLSIESTPGAGTTIEARLPFPA